MRPGLTLLAIIVAPLLGGCGPEAPILALASVASIPVFHRTPIDMAISAASGRDCSVVNLDRGRRYCRPREQPPEKPLFCTRSLGVPDCWEDPLKVPNNPREIADGPRSLTPDQESDRTKHWPGLW
jgi:hypothetical protein